MNNRKVLCARLFVLKTGLPWEHLPQELGRGSGMTAWRRLQLWQKLGSCPMIDVETGEEGPWLKRDLRKACATDHDARSPESFVEILGHSIGGLTYRQFAHRDSLVSKTIMTIPQPTACAGMMQGIDGESSCCRRKVGDTC